MLFGNKIRGVVWRRDVRVPWGCSVADRWACWIDLPFPWRQVEHVTLRMGEGKCVLIGGLARIEVLEGRPFMFTFFVSNDVRLHPTDTRR